LLAISTSSDAGDVAAAKRGLSKEFCDGSPICDSLLRTDADSDTIPDGVATLKAALAAE
jgi:hypothetical protein